MEYTAKGFRTAVMNQSPLPTQITSARSKTQRSVDGNTRGALSERRFLRILLENQDKWPKWLLGVRKATSEENRDEMTDFVVSVTGKEVPIQIKSSSATLRWFLARKRKKARSQILISRIVFLVIEPNCSNIEVWERIKIGLSEKTGFSFSEGSSV